MLLRQQKRQRRHRRVQAKVKGTNEVPRLYVFRSAQHIYAQIIDDEKGRTIAAVGTLEFKKLGATSRKKTDDTEQAQKGKIASAYAVGKLIAKKAHEKKINKVVFDRGGYQYHGRVKAVAQGAREGGLKF